MLTGSLNNHASIPEPRSRTALVPCSNHYCSEGQIMTPVTSYGSILAPFGVCNAVHLYAVASRRVPTQWTFEISSVFQSLRKGSKTRLCTEPPIVNYVH